MGISATDNWALPIDHAKNTEEERTSFRSGTPVWCRLKTLGHENKYPYLRKVKNTCVWYFWW